MVVRQGNVKVNINQTRNPGKWIFQRHAASGQEEKKKKKKSKNKDESNMEPKPLSEKYFN